MPEGGDATGCVAWSASVRAVPLVFDGARAAVLSAAYVNAVAVLRVAPGATEPDPAVLLAWLQAIEADAGRSRSVPNAARTLDLDIIAMGDGGQMVRAVPDPVLPHPRAHLRAFVLVPLLDVAPNWVHPVLRRSAGELLAALPPQEVAVLD